MQPGCEARLIFCQGGGGLSEWRVRGIRGAITVDEDSAEAIAAGVRELLDALVAENRIRPQDVAGIWFTATPDLTAAFPAAAVRSPGWERVPLLCAVEMAVPDGPPRCIRVLVLVNTPVGQDEVRHVYLRGARALRPDLA